jgi:hypothetical protein
LIKPTELGISRLINLSADHDDSVIEAFNSRFRVECLNANWFPILADAREKM